MPILFTAPLPLLLALSIALCACASPQSDALAAITQGVCNTSSDAELCTNPICLAYITCSNVTVFNVTVPNVVIKFDTSYNPLSPYQYPANAPNLIFSSKFGALLGLTQLILRKSNIAGAIPTELGLLTYLGNLNISFCPNIVGTIPDVFGNLKGIQNLNFQAVPVGGTIPISVWKIPVLGAINFINCPNLVGTLPTEIGFGPALRWVTIATCPGLSGTLPTEVGNLKIVSFFRVEIGLTGTVPPHIGNMTGLVYVRLPNNKLTGTLPTELARAPNLRFLDFRKNELTGTLPTEFAQMSLLELGVSSNRFSGSIPDEYYNTRLGASLRDFDIAKNLIGSTLSDKLTFLTNVLRIDVDDNPLIGTLPTILGLLTSLNDLTISRTYISGTIPTEIGNLYNISSLVLSNNRLTGSIPTELGLCGRFARISPPIYLGFVNLDLSNNELAGTIPTEIGLLTNLVLMTLNVNRLTNMPTELGLLRNIYGLFLENNLITSSIPTELQYLGNLSYLRISNNLITGTIPNFGPHWPLLAYFEFSNNKIEGGTFEYFDNLVAMRGNQNKFKSLDFKCRPGSNRTIALLDFSSNEITQMPNFIFESDGVCRITSVQLSQNKIGPTNFSLMNYGIMQLNLGFNLITMPEPRLEWFTPTPGICVCQYLPFANIPNPLERAIDLSANRIAYSTILLVELMGFPDLRDFSFSSSCNFGVLPDYFACDSTITASDCVVDINIEPQDFDDCIVTHDCEHFCVDGWYPVLGYTCGCDTGYKLKVEPNLPARECVPICGDGFLSPEEICDFKYEAYGCEFVNEQCVQANGYDCYTFPSNITGLLKKPTQATGYCAPRCGDGLKLTPEECDDGNTRNGDGCDSTCRIEAGYGCLQPNQPCQPCAGAFGPVSINETFFLFPTFRALGYRLDGLPFTACSGCNGGFAFLTRTVLKVSSCNALSEFNSSTCAFACSNLTVFSSAKESLYTLQQQLTSGDFLNQIMSRFFDATAVMTLTSPENQLKRFAESTTSEKRQARIDKQIIATSSPTESSDGGETSDNVQPIPAGNTITAPNHLAFQIFPCPSGDNASQMMAVLMALAKDIVPNIPDLQASIQGCSITLAASDPVSPINSQSIRSIVIGVVVPIVVLLFLLIASLFAYYYFRSDLHKLPEAIRWSYIHNLTHPWAWSYNGSKSTGYYERQYLPGSGDWKRVEGMLIDNLHCQMVPTEIFAVYNPSLTSSFINHWQVTISRFRNSYDQFFRKGYLKNKAKVAVKERYDQLVNGFVWNVSGNKQTEDVPILAALHGTDYHIAEKIAQTGFAALSSLDAGFFGKGIYFTSFLSYCLPYCFSKQKPAVLFSYLNLGNVFPVTEDHKDKEKTLVGAALKGGYSAHYVLTTKDGNCINQAIHPIETACDEIVLGQESQILPAFIIVLDIEACKSVFANWNREIPQAGTTHEADPLVATDNLDSVISQMSSHELAGDSASEKVELLPEKAIFNSSLFKSRGDSYDTAELDDRYFLM